MASRSNIFESPEVLETVIETTVSSTVKAILASNKDSLEDLETLQRIADNGWLIPTQRRAKIIDRAGGAEINSIARICQKNLLSDYLKLVFLVSETEDGKQTGQLVKLYYENHKNPIQFETVEVKVLTGLRDDNVKAFRQEGLKNLVREISIQVQHSSPECIAINATGGYKAQISFAGMIGQALGIPVYYLFERFSEVIELPPQPIALDLGFWIDHYVVFEQLEAEETLVKSDLTHDFDLTYFNTLIDEEIIEQTPVISLSAMGILFQARSRLQFRKKQTAILNLIPEDQTLPENKRINIREDHGKDKLIAFSKKLTQSPYITKIINSLPFNPHQNNPIRRTYSDGKIEFVLTWTDRGLGICLQTTGRNLAETNTIAIYLAEKFTQST